MLLQVTPFLSSVYLFTFLKLIPFADILSIILHVLLILPIKFVSLPELSVSVMGFGNFLQIGFGMHKLVVLSLSNPAFNKEKKNKNRGEMVEL